MFGLDRKELIELEKFKGTQIRLQVFIKTDLSENPVLHFLLPVCQVELYPFNKEFRSFTGRQCNHPTRIKADPFKKPKRRQLAKFNIIVDNDGGNATILTA